MPRVWSGRGGKMKTAGSQRGWGMEREKMFLRKFNKWGKRILECELQKKICAASQRGSWRGATQFGRKTFGRLTLGWHGIRGDWPIDYWQMVGSQMCRPMTAPAKCLSAKCLSAKRFSINRRGTVGDVSRLKTRRRSWSFSFVRIKHRQEHSVLACPLKKVLANFLQ